MAAGVAHTVDDVCAELLGHLTQGKEGVDSGTEGVDSGTEGVDSGTERMDSGTEGMDSGTEGVDSRAELLGHLAQAPEALDVFQKSDLE
jgi:hypothetical protein